VAIADAAGPTTSSISVSSDDASSLHSVQHVVVYLTISTARRGDLAISLTSPSGVTSVLSPATNDLTADYSSWRFMSVRHWGEAGSDLVGDWVRSLPTLLPYPNRPPASSANPLPSARKQTLSVEDERDGSSDSTLSAWTLNLFGDDSTNVGESLPSGSCYEATDDDAKWGHLVGEGE
jgi:subtilisin-like proprotein convertase family protein